MIDKYTAENVLKQACNTGAEFAEIFIEENIKNNISLVNGEVYSAVSGVDFGFGLRIIKGERVLYTYTNNLESENLIKIAKELATAFSGKNSDFDIVFYEKDYREHERTKEIIMPNTTLKKNIVEMLKSASNAAFNYNNLISQTSMGYMDSVQNVLIINTNGVWVNDKRIRTRASVNAVASNENEKQSGYFGPGALSGLEFYKNINLDEIAKEAARSAVTMLKAKECPGGKMPVVIDNGFGGVIFHEACGHGLEASAVAKNASIFAGKIGSLIANEKVTAIDDGTIPNQWGSINVDDEGTPAKKNILIENGILKNYMVDMYNGKKLGLKSTGASRRQSYKYMPTSRMTNTYIAAGKDKAADIIKSVDYGIYAKYMGGGSVNPETGEFNFAVNEAYIIKNGKIDEPVKGATLIGKGNEILMNIDMISDNVSLAQGMCGASSGSIPVNVGQPMIRVNEITVGGRRA